MNWKVTAVLAVVLCVLIGVHVGLKRHKEQKQEAEEKAKKIYQIEQTDVTELRLAVKDEEEIVGKKDNDTWAIVAPVEAKADAKSIDRILRDFVGAKKQRVVDETPEDLGTYGLDEPAITIGVKTAAEPDTERTLLIGDQNPTKTYYFAKRADEEPVFLISSWLKTSFDKKLKDLRDKKIIDAGKDDISMIELVRADTTIKLEKDGDIWQVREPLASRADKDTMNELLDEIASAEVQDFVDDEPEDLAKYGLANPAATLTVYTGDEKAGQTLLLGSTNEDDTGVYAKRDIADNVVLMKKTLFEKIPTTVDDVRNKNLVLVALPDLRKIEYSTANGSFTMVLDEAGTWYVEKPRRIKADTIELGDLINELGDIEAESFLAETKPEYGFDDPRVKIAMWYKAKGDTAPTEQQPVTALIGAANPDDTTLAYAMNEESVPMIVKLESDTLDKLKKTFFDFRDKVLVDFRRDDVDRMEVAYLDDTVTLERKGDSWSVVAPADVELRDQGVADRLTWTINYLKMSNVVAAETPEDAKQYGLEPPLASFTVNMKDGSTIGPFLIGDEAKSNPDEFYATHAQTPGLYLIKRQVLTDIRERLGDILGRTLKDVSAATRDRQTDRASEAQRAAADAAGKD